MRFIPFNTKQQIAVFLRWLTGDWVYSKKLPTRFGGAKCLVSPRSDIRLLKPGFGESAADLFAVVEHEIQAGDHVWDIGSNLGIFSFAAAFRAGSSGSVHSLEADPRYADLQFRTIRNLPTFYAPVTVLCAAISESAGLFDLVIPKKGHARNHLASVVGNSAGEAEAYKQVVTLTGEFLLNYWPRPDFIKIDVEGAELLALSGFGSLLREVRPRIYIECSFENQSQISKILTGAGYQLFAITNSGEIKEIESCVFNTLAIPISAAS